MGCRTRPEVLTHAEPATRRQIVSGCGFPSRQVATLCRLLQSHHDRRDPAGPSQHSRNKVRVLSFMHGLAHVLRATFHALLVSGFWCA